MPRPRFNLRVAMTTRWPIRHVQNQGWQVLGEAPMAWISCESKEDAELIAGFEALCCDVYDGRASGEDIAAMLDAMAAAVLRNIGHGTSVRFIRHAAKRARGET